MIKINASQALTYETLKQGKFTALAIAKATRRPKGTVHTQLQKLCELGLAESTATIAVIKYKAIEGAYEVVKGTGRRGGTERKQPKVNLEQRPKTVRPRMPKEVSAEDKFLRDMLDIELTEEQHLYLVNHRNKVLRSALAKKLGIPKLQLTLYLERLG